MTRRGGECDRYCPLCICNRVLQTGQVTGLFQTKTPPLGSSSIMRRSPTCFVWAGTRQVIQREEICSTWHSMLPVQDVWTGDGGRSLVPLPFLPVPRPPSRHLETSQIKSLETLKLGHGLYTSEVGTMSKLTPLSKPWGPKGFHTKVCILSGRHAAHASCRAQQHWDTPDQKCC